MENLNKYLSAYQQIIEKFGYMPVREPGRIKILGWDIEYVCGSAIASFIDQLLVKRLNDFIPDNDQPFILDCGSNIGFSVLNYKRMFPKSKIIAFEPDPEFAPVLRRNLTINKVTNVEIVEAAVWTMNGKISWLCEGIDGSRIIEQGHSTAKETVVTTVDLAEYLYDEIDLLKLDIEGAEYEVITHLSDRLNKVKNLYIECHLDQNTINSFADLLKILVDAGYKIGINSFGAWRDLIRQRKVAPPHWEQYIVVAAWRKAIDFDSEQDEFLPYVGIQQLKNKDELQATFNQLKKTQAEFKAKKKQLQIADSKIRDTQMQLEEMKAQLKAKHSELQETHKKILAANIELDYYRNSRLIQLARKITKRQL